MLFPLIFTSLESVVNRTVMIESLGPTDECTFHILEMETRLESAPLGQTHTHTTGYYIYIY